MTRRTLCLALVTAVLLAVLAFVLPAGAFASSLTVKTTATPDALSEPGKISINVVITNNSDTLLEDVTISAHTLTESLGNFEPGSSKSYNITNFSVYPDELGDGITLSFYWTEDGTLQTLNHFVPIALKTLTPSLHAERTASSTAAPSGSEITLTYAVQNTGELPLTNVTITDPALPEPISLGTLEVGSDVVRVERKITITGDVVSTPVVTAESESSSLREELGTMTIVMADAKLELTVTPQSQTEEGIPLLILVKNTGNTELTSIALTDETGSAVTEAFSLTAGEQKEVTFTVNPTTTRDIVITATATYGDGTQPPLVQSSQPVTVEPLLTAEDIVVTLLAKPLRDSYDEPSKVTFAIRIDNDSPTELYDFSISEKNAGTLYTADTLITGAQTVNVELNVSETTTFTFSATFHDANGNTYSSTANDVTVTIAEAGASPAPTDEGGSSSWLLWVMIGFGILFVIAMVSFVVVLVQSSRRREQEREAEELDRILAARQEQHKQDTARLQQLSDPRARRKDDSGLNDGFDPENDPALRQDTVVVRRRAPNLTVGEPERERTVRTDRMEKPENGGRNPRADRTVNRETKKETKREEEVDSLFEDEFK